MSARSTTSALLDLETSLKIAFNPSTQSAHFGIPTELKGRVIALAESGDALMTMARAKVDGFQDHLRNTAFESPVAQEES